MTKHKEFACKFLVNVKIFFYLLTQDTIMTLNQSLLKQSQRQCNFGSIWYKNKNIFPIVNWGKKNIWWSWFRINAFELIKLKKFLRIKFSWYYDLLEKSSLSWVFITTMFQMYLLTFFRCLLYLIKFLQFQTKTFTCISSNYAMGQIG